jgi:hypothetical protein
MAMMSANAVLPRIALIKKVLPCHSNPCTAHRFLDHPASSHQLRRRSVDSHTAIVSARVTAASSHAVGFQHNEPRPDEAAQSGRQRRSYEQLRVRRNWPLSFNPARCLWSGPDRVRCQGRCCHPWDWRPANDKLGRAACSAIGCPAGGIRLTNWDAHALAELVHKGTRWILLIDHVWVVPECLKPKVPPVNARGPDYGAAVRRGRNTHGYPLSELSLPDEVPDFARHRVSTI